jgi:hypothetical protein
MNPPTFTLRHLLIAIAVTCFITSGAWYWHGRTVESVQEVKAGLKHVQIIQEVYSDSLQAWRDTESTHYAEFKALKTGILKEKYPKAYRGRKP